MTWSIGRLLRSFIYGFQREFRPYEKVVIEAALSAMPQVERARIVQHLNARERLQRSNSDRIIIIDTERRSECERIETQGIVHVCAAVVLAGPSVQMVAKLLLNRGVLHTLEFSGPPASLGTETPSVVKVTRNPGGRGYTQDIDAEEHGKPRGDA
jgi:hypothetical protein